MRARRIARTKRKTIPAPARGSIRLVDPAALRDLAERAARAGGELLLDRLHDPRTVAAKSTPTDLVSEVDHASEELVVGLIRAERPDDAVLAEEGGGVTGSTGLRWVVDPLDGTINYVYRGSAFAVSVAVEDAAGALAGAVYDPQRDELYSAARGAGATRNGTPITCSPATDLAHTLVATGFAYAAERRAEQGRVVAALLPQVRDIRRSGSAALDWCALAGGRVDAYYELGTAAWDFAAGALIAAEAGAVVGDLDGGPPSTTFVLGAAPDVFPALRDLLQLLHKDEQKTGKITPE
jgi:myo-inositol-1(or 4)-monophosphatase